MMIRFSKILIVASLIFGAILCKIAFSGEMYSTMTFYRNLEVGSWTAVTGITNTFTNGGTYTNGVHTNHYRVYGTNDLGRTPTSSVYTVIFTGNTNSTNAVILQWTRYNGILNTVIEGGSSGTVGAISVCTNWIAQTTGGGDTNFTDFGTNIMTHTNRFSDQYMSTEIPAPSFQTTVTNSTHLGGVTSSLWCTDAEMASATNTLTGIITAVSNHVDSSTNTLRIWTTNFIEQTFDGSTNITTVGTLSGGIISATLLTNDIPHHCFATNAGMAGQILYTSNGTNQYWGSASGAGDIKADGTVPFAADVDFGGFAPTNMSHIELITNAAHEAAVSTKLIQYVTGNKLYFVYSDGATTTTNYVDLQ